MDVFISAVADRLGSNMALANLAIVGLVCIVLWLVKRTLDRLDAIEKTTGNICRDLAVIKDRLGIE